MTEELAVKGFIQKEIMRNNGREGLEETENLIERGIIDSLGIVKLLDYLETSFGIDVADDELVPSNFETVQKIALFVRSKQARKISKGNSRQYYVQPGV